MKFTVEVDSNFDVDIDAFIEIMNEQVLTDSDFIMGMASSRAFYGNEVIKLKVLEKKTMMKTKRELHGYLFKVTGGFNIDSRFKPVYACNGQDIVGFTTPDGREVNIEVCLRFEGDDNEQYVISEREMADNGFCNLDYDYADFYRNEQDDYQE